MNYLSFIGSSICYKEVLGTASGEYVGNSPPLEALPESDLAQLWTPPEFEPAQLVEFAREQYGQYPLWKS